MVPMTRSGNKNMLLDCLQLIYTPLFSEGLDKIYGFCSAGMD